MPSLTPQQRAELLLRLEAVDTDRTRILAELEDRRRSIILEARALGAPMAEVAEMLGWSRQYLYRYMGGFDDERRRGPAPQAATISG